MIERPKTTTVSAVTLSIDGEGEIDAGAIQRVTLTYSVADYALTDARLQLKVPTGLRIVAVDEPGVVASSERSARWSFPALALGNHTTQFSIQANETIENDLALTIQATLDSDQNEAIATSLVISTLSSPKLALTLSITRDTLVAGSSAPLTMSIANSGTDAARDLILTIDPNEGLTTIAPITIPTLHAGETITRIVDLRIDPSATTGTRNISVGLSASQTTPLSASTEITIAARQGQVLGASTELPASGITFFDWLLVVFATILLTAGISTFAFYPFSKHPSA